MGRFLVDLALNLLRLPLFPFWWSMRFLRRPRQSWIRVEIRPRIVEIERPGHVLTRWIPGLGERAPTSLRALRELREQIARDPRIEGVLFVLPSLSAGWSAVTALRTELERLRAAGKRVVAYLPEGGGNRELYLASAADRVLTSPHATLAPLGVAAQSRYLKGLLDKVGVSVEVHRRAEFKTAVEPAVRDSMSEPQREQLGALLDVVDRALCEALASRPALGPSAEARRAKVQALFGEALLDGARALEAGLVDGLTYEDGLARALRPDGPEPKIVRAPRYFRHHRARFFRPIGPRPFLAIVPVHGAITSGPGPSPAGSVAAGTTVAALRALAEDPRALGVVLHIDSPGGSALASDLIHREVELLREKKPVVACFGEVAASGGYYVAAPAAAIVAQPLAITGSIGVIAARLVAAELLDKAGIRTEVLRRAPHADLFSSPRPMDEAEHAILEREIDAFYRGFVAVVAKGRRRSEAEIEPLARGRVWSGADAHVRGLVDVLGGLDTALDEVRSRLLLVPGPLRARIPVRVLWPDPGMPPLPFAATLAPALAPVLAALEPALADLLALLGGGDRMLYYAPGLPRIE